MNSSSFPDLPPRHPAQPVPPVSGGGLPAEGKDRVQRTLEELEARFAAGENDIELNFGEFRMRIIRPCGNGEG